MLVYTVTLCNAYLLDLLQASVVLPIHLLSFALLVRHRDGVKNEELECSLEEILEELKSMDMLVRCSLLSLFSPFFIIYFIFFSFYEEKKFASFLLKHFATFFQHFRFLGFSGDIESVTMYGIEILCNQKLVSIVNNVVTPLLHDPITACSLFTYSLKVLVCLFFF